MRSVPDETMDRLEDARKALEVETYRSPLWDARIPKDVKQAISDLCHAAYMVGFAHPISDERSQNEDRQSQG